MDPILAAGLLACVVAAVGAVVTARSALVAPSGFVLRDPAADDDLRTLGLVLAAFAAGLATLGLVVAAMALLLEAFDAWLPAPVSLALGALVGLAGIAQAAVYRTYRRGPRDAPRPGSATGTRRGRTIVLGAVFEGLGVVAVVVLLLGLFLG